MSGGRNVLIVYAHQDCHSFNCALKNAAVDALTSAGHSVKVSDLYAMHFKATTTKDDVRGSFQNEVFNYGDETAAAYLEGRLSTDVMTEIEKIRWANLIIFQFPMYTLGVPAILKGWFDRVFINGFAFVVPDKTREHGLLKGKRAILSFTTGSPRNEYRCDGPYGDMDACLWPLEAGALNFSGMSVMQANVCYEVQFVSQEQRKEMLAEWTRRVPGLFDEKPKTFFKSDDFDQNGTLKKTSLEKAIKEGHIPAGNLRAASSGLA